MIKGLTDRAQRIFSVTAQDEARRCRAQKLQPEHIILGILREGNGKGCKALRALQVDIKDMYRYISKRANQVMGAAPTGNVTHSMQVARMLEDAAGSARDMGSEYVGTEHLLLAALRNEQNSPARFLNKAGVTPTVIRQLLEKHQQKSTSERIPIGNVTGKVIHKKLFPQMRSQNGQGGARTSGSPILDEFATDLTKIAQERAVDPVIGRAKEVSRLVNILARRNKNNPVLVGEPGVGKTAIVEGLAQLIVSDDAPELLIDKRILSLDLAGLVAGTKYRGEFEDRVRRLMKELRNNKNMILFIDELHMLIGAGGAEGAIDAANMFKPALSRGEIQCVGATTLNEYKKHIEKDTALERRFQPVIVDEPTIEETVDILKGIKSKYEEYHGVLYNEQSLRLAAEYAKRYISDRFLPDKAIDVIDEAGARRRVAEGSPPKQIVQLQKQIELLDSEKLASVSVQNYEDAAAIRDEANQLRAKLEEMREQWRKNLRASRGNITEEDVVAVVSEMSGVPLQQLEGDEQQRLAEMEEYLSNEIIGQHEAVRQISSAIRKARVGLHAPHQPLGSFIFLGTSGVGKTLSAKRLAAFLFGSEDALLRIDMSDYMEKHTVSRLVGAPPGYVGYNEGGILTERVRNKPYSVILFDEIEKAHPDFFNILLQILEEGELQDNLGHSVSFRNTILIMTSNVGTELIGASKVGFHGDAHNTSARQLTELHNEQRRQAIKKLKSTFRAEFINRIDNITFFAPLEHESLEKIFDLLFAEFQKRLKAKNIDITIPKTVRAFIINQRDSEQSGARPLRRLISRYIEEPLSLRIIEGSVVSNDTITVRKSSDGQGVKFSIKHAAAAKNKKLPVRSAPQDSPAAPAAGAPADAGAEGTDAASREDGAQATSNADAPPADSINKNTESDTVATETPQNA